VRQVGQLPRIILLSMSV